MTRSKVINSLADMTDFGLNPLTGEACAFNMRLLCDVSEDGKLLLENFFSVREITLLMHMNSYVGDKDAIGCIMLSKDALFELAAFALLRDNYDVVIPSQPGHDTVHGFDIDTETGLAYYEKMRGSLIIRRRFPNPN